MVIRKSRHAVPSGAGMSPNISMQGILEINCTSIVAVPVDTSIVCVFVRLRRSGSSCSSNNVAVAPTNRLIPPKVFTTSSNRSCSIFVLESPGSTFTLTFVLARTGVGRRFVGLDVGSDVGFLVVGALVVGFVGASVGL